ncbi:MAG: monofunctional biosynthetic peptidoglycan transglycosylase [Alphaproteobacteria bacterium]|nr:monofunctional biosynthetic peptidoglycan transglycosylase [Alphaproteobacteria bacterium]
MRAKIRPFWQRVWRWLLLLPVVLVGVSILLVALYRFVPPPLTPLMVIRTFDDRYQAAHADRRWRPLAAISPNMQRAVIAAEDMKFCQHFGFDWVAIQAVWRDYRNGARGTQLRGASTITMQTAKNVFLWPSRSLLRKGAEAWFTLLIEAIWSKARILEVYLNVIEWGDGIYGVEAAAQRYFGRPAAKLSAAQAARLAAILPNPRIFSASDPSDYIARRGRTILTRMRDVPIKNGATCP